MLTQSLQERHPPNVEFEDKAQQNTPSSDQNTTQKPGLRNHLESEKIYLQDTEAVLLGPITFDDDE